MTLLSLSLLAPSLLGRPAEAQPARDGRPGATIAPQDGEERDNPREREKFWEVRRNGITAKDIAEARARAARLPKATRLPQVDGRDASSKAAAPGGTPWVSIGPAPITSGGTPFSGRVPALAADPTNPNVVYLGGANGGVWKSTDRGNSWTPMADESTLPTLVIGSIAVNPNNPGIVYAGTGEPNGGSSRIGRGLFKTINGGASWTLVGDGDPFPVGGTLAYRVLVQPDNSVWVAANVGLFRSSDGGVTWKRFKSGAGIPPQVQVWDLAMSRDGQRMLAVLQGRGVYRSTDFGSTWARVGSGLPADLNAAWNRRSRIAVSRSNGSVAYLLIDPYDATNTSPSTLYVTTDGGTSWRLVSSQPNVQPTYQGYSIELAVDPANENLVYVLGFGVAVNTQALGTGTWQPVPDGGHPDQHAISFPSCPAAPCPFYLGNDGGAFFLQPNPDPTHASVNNLNRTLAITELTGGDLGNNFVQDPRAISGSQDNGTMVWVAADTQNITPYNWIQTLGGDGGYAYFEHSPSSPRFAYGEQQYGCQTFNGLFKSTFWGYTWGSLCTGLSGVPTQFYPFYTPDRRDPQHLAFAAGSGVYEIVSPQSAWYRSNRVDLPGTPLSLAIAPSDSRVIYAGLLGSPSSGNFFRTGNAYSAAAADYVLRTGGGALPPGFTVNSIAVDPTNADRVYVAGSLYSTLAQVVYKTVDGGLSWANISGSLPPRLPAYSVVTYKAGSTNVLVIGTEIGVFYSTTEGQSWVSFNAGLPATRVVQLALDNDQTTLAAFTAGRGAFTTNIGGGTVCSYSLSATAQSFGASAGAGNVGVTAPAGCAWGAASTVAWLHVTAGASGSGSGTVGYTVDANPGTAQRTGTLTVAGLTFTVTQAGGSPQTPFLGVPFNVPGTLEAEDFDQGGEGVAWHDADAGNGWGLYRTDVDVDIAATADVGGGYMVANAWAGEWIEYTVNVPAAGTYNFEARVASDGLGGTFHVELGGVDKTGPIQVPNTGGWDTWQTLTKAGLSLSAGQQVMRVALDTNGGQLYPAIANFNYFRIVAATANQPPTVSLTAPGAGQTYTAPASVTLTASAADADGTISKVEFYHDGYFLVAVTTAPYSFTQGNVQAGSYALTARATDNAGAVTTSPVVNITVNPAATAYEGWHDGADCSTIYGWAADRNRLNSSISVDIYDGGTLLATVAANQLRPDVGAYLGDNGYHGFSYTVPASLKNGQAHSITVKFGGSATSLAGTPKAITC